MLSFGRHSEIIETKLK